MRDASACKMLCPSCGVGIEFPARGVGIEVPCPRDGEGTVKTTLPRR